MYLGGSGGHQAVVRETKASYVMVGYVKFDKQYVKLQSSTARIEGMYLGGSCGHQATSPVARLSIVGFNMVPTYVKPIRQITEFGMFLGGSGGHQAVVRET